MKNFTLIILILLFLVGNLPSGICEESTISIEVLNIRHSYYRNEKQTFNISIVGSGVSETKAVDISLVIDPLKPLNKTITISKTSSKKNSIVSYPVMFSLLKPGDYSLDISVKTGDDEISESFPVYVAEPPNPQRMPVHYWGSAAGQMDWGVKHGFNTFQAYFIRPLEEGSKTDKQHHNNFDKAVKNRLNLGGYFYTVHNTNFKDHPEVLGIHRKEDGTVIDNQVAKKICLNEPFIIDHCERTVHQAMRLYGKYPSFFQALLNSEFRSNPCYSERCRTIMKNETGLDLYDVNVDPLHPPKTEAEARELGLPEHLVKAVPKNGLIDEDNPYYRYYLWWWKQGMGDVPLNHKLSDIIHDYKPDVITWHDPYRLAPVYGRHKGLNCIGQWTYTHPDPKYTLYVETLIAGAKPENQMVMPDMTTWVYQNWAAPTDSGVVFQHPDILRENC